MIKLYHTFYYGNMTQKEQEQLRRFYSNDIQKIIRKDWDRRLILVTL